jgi:hypothetical protein
MKPFFQPKSAPLASTHQFDRLFNVELGVTVPEGETVSLAEFFNQSPALSSQRSTSSRRAMGFHTTLHHT